MNYDKIPHLLFTKSNFVLYLVIMRTRRIIFISCVILLVLARYSTSCSAQEIWFFPTDNLPRRGHVNSPDYMQLFDDKPKWKKALSRVQVFQMTPLFPIRASDQDLIRLFSFLKQHHIALALNMGLIANERGECGHGEGYINPQEADLVIRRVKSLGGEPKYLVGDEPLYFGHTAKNKDVCQYTISELATRVAVIVDKVTAAFPDIEICMAEPVPGDAVWELEKWISAFHTATGRRISAFQIDMDWRKPEWPLLIERTRRMLAKAKVKFGIIYDSSGPMNSDYDAFTSTKANVELFEHTSPGRPDQVLFENWTHHPSHVLPETDITSHSYIINWYFDRRNLGTN